MKSKIIIVSGGTLGHVKPGLMLSKRLFENGYEIIFISTKQFEKTLCNFNYINKLYILSSYGIDKNIIKNISKLINNIKTYKKIKTIIKNEKAICIIGMGGSISTLGLLSTRNDKIIKVIHEQNKIIGRGNNFIKKYAHLKFSAYELEGFIKVGNPLESITNTFNKNKKGILITTGTNGSTFINDFVFDNIDYISKLSTKIYIITGLKYYNQNYNKIQKILKLYSNINIISLTDKINELYHECKLVITRGGASTISEILSFNLLALVIPSPNVYANHQYENSKYYYDKGCFEMLNESELNINTFLNKINKLIVNEKYYINNINNNINRNCLNVICDSIDNILRRKYE